MSLLRRVLDEVTAAGPGATVNGIAATVGASPDEVRAMIDYWVRRGRLAAEQIGGCPPRGCAGCAPRAQGSCPVLLAITPVLPR